MALHFLWTSTQNTLIVIQVLLTTSDIDIGSDTQVPENQGGNGVTGKLSHRQQCCKATGVRQPFPLTMASTQ